MGESPACQLQPSVYGLPSKESRSSELECKVGGKFHLKLEYLLETDSKQVP